MHRMRASVLWLYSVASVEERRFRPPGRLNAKSSLVDFSVMKKLTLSAH